jgi:HEAT repeat protein
VRAAQRLAKLLGLVGLGGDESKTTNEYAALVSLTLPALRKLLEDPEPAVRGAAAEALGHLGAKEAVHDLLKLLRDVDASLRGAAARALGCLGAEKYAPELRMLLTDQVASVRGAAAEALGRVRDKQAVPVLLKLLQDVDDSPRGAAAEALGRLGAKEAAPQLRVLLKDPEPVVRARGADLLGRLGAPEAVPDLLNLCDDQALVRLSAARALGRLDDKKAVPQLLKLLRDAEQPVRGVAAEALGRLGAKEAVPELLKLFQGADDSPRGAAAEALGRLDAKEAVPQLLTLLTDLVASVRGAAAEALGRLDAKEAVPQLLTLLTDPVASVRGAAAEALGRLGAREAVPQLLTLLAHGAPSARHLAAAVLEGLGPGSPLPFLKLAYEEPESIYDARWLAHYWGGGDKRAEILCEYLGRPSSSPELPKARADALLVLDVLGEAWDESASFGLRNDVAQWATVIITDLSEAWRAKDLEALQKYRQRFQDQAGARVYVAAIERVIASLTVWPSPPVRTLLAVALVDLMALLAFVIAPAYGALPRWLPSIAYAGGGAGLIVANVVGSPHLYLDTWLLTELLLVQLAILCSASVFSPVLLHHVARIEPLSRIAFFLTLRMRRSRRRFFQEYVRKVRYRVTWEKKQVNHESYFALPAYTSTSSVPVATLHHSPASVIVGFLTGRLGERGHVLIEAPGGQGKSALLREVVLQALEQFEKDPTGSPLPVLLSHWDVSLEKMVERELGAVLMFPQSLASHFEAGDFFLVLDGVGESGFTQEVLTNFLRGPYGASTRLLLSSRPTRAYRSLIQGSPDWMLASPRRLDDGLLDAFLRHYGGRMLSTAEKAVCRAPDGTYLPILVRMAMASHDHGVGVRIADIYRSYFLQLFANGSLDDHERLKRLMEAARWCLETYWLDGSRKHFYEPTDLQRQMLQAGILVPADGLEPPNEVQFFHDSMQSYLTAVSLAEQDRAGYANLPRPADVVDTEPWDRGRVLLRVAANPMFVGTREDHHLAGPGELFQMCLETVAPTDDLRRWLRDEVLRWAEEHNENLRRRDVLDAVAPELRNSLRSYRGVARLLFKAADASFLADEEKGGVEQLGRLYAALAPFIYELQGAGDGKVPQVVGAGPPGFRQQPNRPAVLPRNLAVSHEFEELWSSAAAHLTDDLKTFEKQVIPILGKLCAVLDLALSDEPRPANQGKVTTFIIDVAAVFGDLTIHPTIPIIFFAGRELTEADVDDLQVTLARVKHQRGRVAFVVFFFREADRLANARRAIDQRLRQAHAHSVCVFDYDRLLVLVRGASPRQALRKSVLSEIDLTSVSPFTTTGATPPDMFFGREKELREIAERARDTSYALVGGRKIGKTSILQRLHLERLPAANCYALYHDCSTTTTPESFLAAPIRGSWAEPAPQAPATIEELLGTLPLDRPVVLLLDEADELVQQDRARDWALFKRLRSQSNSRHAQVVLSGERALMDALGGSSGPHFNFAQVRLIRRLDVSAVEELVTRPMRRLEIGLAPPQLVTRLIWDFTCGHPNVVQCLCQRLIQRLNERENRTISPEDVEVVIKDPNFVRQEFLATYFSRATVLEQLCAMLMADDDKLHTLGEIHRAFGVQGIDVTLNQIDGALDRLVRLRDMVARTEDAGYTFAVPAIPKVLAEAPELSDLIALRRELYQAAGDVDPESVPPEMRGRVW